MGRFYMYCKVLDDPENVLNVPANVEVVTMGNYMSIIKVDDKYLTIKGQDQKYSNPNNTISILSNLLIPLRNENLKLI